MFHASYEGDLTPDISGVGVDQSPPSQLRFEITNLNLYLFIDYMKFVKKSKSLWICGPDGNRTRNP